MTATDRLGLAAIAACLAWAAVAMADGPAPPRFERVVSVYDGDTFRTRESGSVRLLGLDTPEIRGACALEKRLAVEARDALRSLLGYGSPENGVALRRTLDDRGRRQADRDRYNRLLRAGANREGVDLTEAMLAARSRDGRPLAVPYWGRGPKRDWCAP